MLLGKNTMTTSLGDVDRVFHHNVMLAVQVTTPGMLKPQTHKQ